MSNALRQVAYPRLFAHHWRNMLGKKGTVPLAKAQPNTPGFRGARAMGLTASEALTSEGLDRSVIDAGKDLVGAVVDGKGGDGDASNGP